MGPQPSPERRSVRVRGLEISYLEWGLPKAGRPSLLLLHGLMATAETLAALAEPLATGRHIIAVDLPGNGCSERRQTIDASFTGLANLLLDLAGELGLRSPVLLGHSHGGAIALRMATLDPSFASALILLCPAHPFSGHERAVVTFYLSPAGRAFAHTIPWLPRRLQVFGFQQQMLGDRSNVDPVRWEPYRSNLRRPGTVQHILRLLKNWNEDMDHLGVILRERIVDLPALLFWGAEDRVVPARTAASLQQYLGRSELKLLPRVGHLPNEEAPAVCAAEIGNWLTRLGL